MALVGHAWAFVGTSVDPSGDGPASLQATGSSNPKTESATFEAFDFGRILGQVITAAAGAVVT